MRKLAAVLVVLIAAAAFAESDSAHLDHLRMMIHAMSQHGAVVQESAIAPQAAKAINITAQCFQFTPSTFTVDQGDVVTLTLTVPSEKKTSSCNAVGHGLLMDTYVESGITVNNGQSQSVTFTATTPGTFAWVCTQSSCGIGHSSMIGQMIVRAAPQFAITSISPDSGPTSGGTAVTIKGSGFQSGAAVTFGGVPAKDVNVVDANTITSVTPLGPASEQLTVDVVVTNPDGTSVTLHPGFHYTLPAPEITSITPNVLLPAGGTVVTIVGAGFTTAVNSTVTFGGVPATDVRVLDAITMQVTAPPHAEGVVDVAVTVGGTNVVKAGAATYKTPALRRRAAHH